MKIEYHKPTKYERRRRAGFWLSTSNFLLRSAIIYSITVLASIIIGLMLIAKLLVKAGG